MTSEETITFPQLEDMLAARNADDGTRVPHEVALEIMRGKRPILAFREHQGMTLRELSQKTGIATGYISEIERGRKPGSASALARIARALGTSIESLPECIHVAVQRTHVDHTTRYRWRRHYGVVGFVAPDHGAGVGGAL